MGGPGQIHSLVPVRTPTSSNIVNSQVVSDFGSERSIEPFGLPSMDAPPLRECALRNNGVLQKLRKLQNNSELSR
jgi:hypothetical protein